MAHRRYTVESVQRALEHHVSTGALHSVALGENGKRFLVSYDELEDTQLLTLREAWALVIGLRRGEITYGLGVRGQWRDLQGRMTTEPRCPAFSPSGQRCLKRAHAGTGHEGPTEQWIAHVEAAR